MLDTKRTLDDLTNEELISLAKNGNEDAYNFLFERNQKLVYHIVNSFDNIKHVDEDDKVQIAFMGMLKAYNYYKPEKGIKFSTFAVRIIQNEILMEVRRFKKYSKDVSISTILIKDGDGNDLTLEETLTEEEPTFSIEYFWDFNKDLKLFKEALNEKESRMLEMHLNGLSQRDIAADFNMNQASVSRNLKVVFTKLRYIAEHGMLDKSFSINTVCYGGNARKRNEVNKETLIYIFQNYPELTIKEISKIVKCSDKTIYRHRTSFDNGEYKEISPSSEIKEMVQKFLRTKSA